MFSATVYGSSLMLCLLFWWRYSYTNIYIQSLTLLNRMRLHWNIPCVNPNYFLGMKQPPCYILLHNVCSNSSKLYEIWRLFIKFIWDLNSEFFFLQKFGLIFAVPALFHDHALFLLNVFCWKNDYILVILVAFQSKRFRKKFIDFSNNIFPI